MSEPRVLNMKRDPADAIQNGVYVGRPSRWGNPFWISPQCPRSEAIKRFEAYLLASPGLLAEVRKELAGKDLVCYCAPLPCHADVLLRIANA